VTLVAVVGDCATTLSVGLAASWPIGQRCIVVEFDPTGGDLAAWLDVPRQPGLSQLAASGAAHTWAGVEQSLQRSDRGIEAIVAPTRALEATAAVAAATAPLLPVLSAVADTVAVVDAGRQIGSAANVITAADFVVVSHRQHIGSAPAAATGIERLADACAALARRGKRYVVALIGDRPYGVDEVARFVGAPLATSVAIDEWAAAVLSGRAGSAIRHRRSPLMASLAELSRMVSASLFDAQIDVSAEGMGAHDRVALVSHG
jgi:hypothetical protein